MYDRSNGNPSQYVEQFAKQSFEVASEVPPSFVGDVARRLETLSMLLDEIANPLISLTDRLFGSAPRPAPGANQANKSTGQAPVLIACMEALIDRARYVRDEAQTLNSRI